MAHSLPEPSTSTLRRPNPSYSPIAKLSNAFELDPATRSYRHQFSNIYFIRLVELRPIVEVRAQERWKNVRGKPPLLPRILNLQRSQLCYIVGTVYMEMKLKPNVLEDLARDHWIAPPAPRPKFFSSQDAVHLEDESGRVRLVGEVIKRERDREGGGLVTGVIMAVLGVETTSGDFEVIDVCFAGMPELIVPEAGPSNSAANSIPNGKGKEKANADADANGKQSTPEEETWVALVSGLSVGAQEAPADLKVQLLVEWLIGENGGRQDQLQGGRIARLILAGNSLTNPVRGEDDKKPVGQIIDLRGAADAPIQKRFNSTAKELFPSNPTKALTTLLSDILSSSLPITILPGPGDPAGATLPQQALPKVMLGGKRMAGLDSVTNPCWFELGGKSFLGTGGQTLDDVYKYLPSRARLSMAARMLTWRHLAPTAPDTLWIYPFPDTDPFVVHHRPSIYFLGNQPEFETALIGDPEEPTRIILLPSFAKTGQICLVCLETLECKTVEFEVPSWIGEVNGTKAEAEGDADME